MLGPLPLAISVLAFPPEPENAAGNGGVVSKGEIIPLPYANILQPSHPSLGNTPSSKAMSTKRHVQERSV